MEFRRSKPVSLKVHPLYNEKWLQGLLAEDPHRRERVAEVVDQVSKQCDRTGQEEYRKLCPGCEPEHGQANRDRLDSLA